MPDGRRTTFAFSLVPDTCNSGDELALCARPVWTAPPGVNASLKPIVDNKLAFLLNSGVEWWTDDGSASPDNYDFSGFILTTGDGTQSQSLSGTSCCEWGVCRGGGRLTCQVGVR